MDNEKKNPAQEQAEYHTERLVGQIAGNFSEGDIIELRANVRDVTDWTDQNAPQGESTNAEGNIEFRKEGEVEWDGYLAISDESQGVRKETETIANKLRARGFTVNIVEE